MSDQIGWYRTKLDKAGYTFDNYARGKGSSGIHAA